MNTESSPEAKSRVHRGAETENSGTFQRS